jgi:hypothetical protein
MEKPFIQIDDLVREMTEKEYAEYLKTISNVPSLADNNE